MTQTSKLVVFSAICLLTISACKRDDAQVEFERDALALPSNITSTNEFGIVDEDDSNDWRVSPLYVSLISVEPAFPNPTNGDVIKIEISLTGLTTVSGFNVYFLNENSPLTYVSSLTFNPDNFFQVIQVNPLLFSPTSNLSDARGLHRVIVYDQRNEVITYGDIEVQ